ncbi:hypothetical protein SDC9_191349 [bioreactor metagenome]|uniref:Uncharacterized protein n=1 Tax=bioreactor metagenome TaxID=1076179 RepID=A0A645HXQ6_9ZZZZ
MTVDRFTDDPGDAKQRFGTVGCRNDFGDLNPAKPDFAGRPFGRVKNQTVDIVGAGELDGKFIMLPRRRAFECLRAAAGPARGGQINSGAAQVFAFGFKGNLVFASRHQRMILFDPGDGAAVKIEKQYGNFLSVGSGDIRRPGAARGNPDPAFRKALSVEFGEIAVHGEFGCGDEGHCRDCREP